MTQQLFQSFNIIFILDSRIWNNKPCMYCRCRTGKKYQHTRGPSIKLQDPPPPLSATFSISIFTSQIHSIGILEKIPQKLMSTIFFCFSPQHKTRVLISSVESIVKSIEKEGVVLPVQFYVFGREPSRGGS